MYLQLTADNCKNFNDHLSEKDILYKYQITIARSYIGKYQHEFVAVCTSMCILDFMHNLSCAFLHLSHTHDWDEHSAAGRTTFSHRTMLVWGSLRLAQTITKHTLWKLVNF